uniref:Helicase ATP-binding domain-containing protein n=1 Tax=Rhabditophanes sp. KR3021 TaxID=114890 RepID=A0AC35U9E5_9BILA
MPIVEIENTSISFPYEPYECQTDFMRSVLQALNQRANGALESPTGTENSKDGTGAASLTFPKIIYASRTHSQLAQVVRELNKTTYKHFNTVVLASRDQLCINEKVQKVQNSHAKAMLCRNLVSKRGCRHYLGLENDDKMGDSLYENEGNVMDIEDLVKLAKSNCHCPYYKSRQSFDKADLILLPYNYILDPKLRAAQKIELKGNIVIFDEAHNLENICEDSSSIDFSSKHLALCIKECKSILELYIDVEEGIREEMDNTDAAFGEAGTDKKFNFEKNDAVQLLIMLQKLEEVIDSLDLSTGSVIQNLPGNIFEGGKMIDLLKSAEIQKEASPNICLLIDKMGQFVMTHQFLAKNFDLENADQLKEFANLISTVYADSNEPNVGGGKDGNPASQLFKLYIEKEATEIKIHYWCFSAGYSMRYLQSRGVHSIIVASGTLSPLKQFINSMGIPFLIRLENGHAAKSTQICAGAIKAGDNNEVLLGTFQNRGNVAYMTGVGQVIYEAAKIIPQGIIVFFPAYAQMYSFIKSWKEDKFLKDSNIYRELERFKDVYSEPKNKTEVNLIMANFEKSVDSNKGAILFAVCRGKMSEGIDFKDSQSRAVFIIGIPYPPLMDPRVLLKKDYLTHRKKVDSLTIAPTEWYKLEGIRAINQAIGRIIRHKDDFGSVFLLDQRFTTMDKNYFPSWMRASINIYGTAKPFLEICGRFFRERGVQMQRSLAAGLNSKSITESTGFSYAKDDGHFIKPKRSHIKIEEDSSFTTFVQGHYSEDQKLIPKLTSGVNDAQPRKRKITIVKLPGSGGIKKSKGNESDKPKSSVASDQIAQIETVPKEVHVNRIPSKEDYAKIVSKLNDFNDGFV